MARNTRKFEQQFQWEVDRLVFRHRQRGLPVEVSEDERDRLVERSSRSRCTSVIDFIASKCG